MAIKNLNELDSLTPTIDDLVPTLDSSDTTNLKKTTWQLVRDLYKSNFDTVYEVLSNKSTSVTTDQASNTKYPSVKSVYDWVTGAFAKYSGDADFYQYSIERTVSGGNLTVSLKNYEGNDPTPSKPVKIMIGGVVRTITSASNYVTYTTINSGTNYLNCGSSELSTKEIDFFTYIGWDSLSSVVRILASRIPNANYITDFVNSSTNEKGFLNGALNYTAGDPVVNIGRFNAILSGGEGYTWSIPATSVIVNRPIYETRPLDFIPTLYGTGGSIGTFTADYEGKYTIRGNQVLFSFKTKCTNVGSWSGSVYTNLPFTSVGLGEQACSGWFCQNGTNPAIASKAYPVIFSNLIKGLSSVDYAVINWGTFVVNDHIRSQGFYNI